MSDTVELDLWLVESPVWQGAHRGFKMLQLHCKVGRSNLVAARRVQSEDNGRMRVWINQSSIAAVEDGQPR